MNGWAAFDHDAATWIARRLDPSLALQEGWAPPDWTEGIGAIRRTFGLDRNAHFLLHHRGLLPRLWERQVTEALRTMLMEVPGRTLERCQALLNALEGANAPQLAQVDLITADGNDRIDLAVHCRDADGTAVCLAIEAKFEYDSFNGQLKRYLEHLRTAYPRPEQRRLWVVAPDKSSKTAGVLAKRENAEWRFASWKRLLLAWQRELPDDPGTDILSLFSEIWKRVGGN